MTAIGRAETDYSGATVHCLRPGLDGKPSDWKTYKLVKPIGDRPGGASICYHMQDLAPPMIAKIYKRQMLPQVRSKHALHQLRVLTGNVGSLQVELPHVAWPRRMIFSKPNVTFGTQDFADSFLGFQMRYLGDTVNLLQFACVTTQRLNVRPVNSVHVAKLLAQQVADLHANSWKFNIIDMSPNNIRISVDYKSVYFIDADSFQYETGHGFYKAEGRTPGYKAPWTDSDIAAGRKLDERHDNFVLAINLFLILTGIFARVGFHPFKQGSNDEDELISRQIFPAVRTDEYAFHDAKKNVFKSLPEKLRLMFTQAFTHGKPPAASEWASALDQYWGALRRV